MSDMLSQEEINALLAGESSDDTNEPSPEPTEETSAEDSSLLTEEEKDALGEIGNISMGTAATTLFTLLNKKVSITTPKVQEVTIEEVFSRFDDPCVTISVGYTVGIQGTNLMIINSKDVKVITDLMLGGDGTNIEGELSEMHLSAISEAMNQMIGSSSTSLSEMLGKMIDISPPVAVSKPVEEMLEEFDDYPTNEPSVLVSFAMEVGDLIDSEIMQMMPISMAKDLIQAMTSVYEEDPSEDIEEIPQESSAPAPTPEPAPAPSPQAPPQQEPPMTQGGYYVEKPQPVVNAQNVQFQSFDQRVDLTHIASDIALIKEVPLEISVELGRTVKKISEILDFSDGYIIELNQIVGEPLNILANGKAVAKGEVVVIEENYGVRITDIVVPDKNK